MMDEMMMKKMMMGGAPEMDMDSIDNSSIKELIQALSKMVAEKGQSMPDAMSIEIEKQDPMEAGEEAADMGGAMGAEIGMSPESDDEMVKKLAMSKMMKKY